MEGSVCNSLPKRERLHGRTSIAELLGKGRHGCAGDLKFLYRTDNGIGHNRVMVAVPKKLFKRAVKRNLLKRRIRESFRKQKHDLASAGGIDLLLTYSTKEILSYEQIYQNVGTVIASINKYLSRQKPAKSETENEPKTE